MNLSEKEQQGKEMRQSAVIIIFIALAALFFLILEQLKVTHLLDSFNKVPFFVLAVFFLVMGILSLGSAKRAKLSAKTANENVNTVKEWFKNNVTKEDFGALSDDDSENEELYLQKIGRVNALIAQNFPYMRDLPDNLDEEIVNEIFK